MFRFTNPVHAPILPAVSAAAGTNGRVADEISLLDIIIVLAERKRTIFWVTAIFAVLAIIVSLLLPKQYTASVVLLPPQQNSSMSATALSSQLGNMGGIAALAGGGLWA